MGIIQPSLPKKKIKTAQGIDPNTEQDTYISHHILCIAVCEMHWNSAVFRRHSIYVK